MRRYGENVGENIGNPLETKRNIVRTHWEVGKNEKKSLSSTPFSTPITSQYHHTT